MFFLTQCCCNFKRIFDCTKKSKYAHTPHIDAIILTDYFSSFIYVWEENTVHI